MRAVHARRACGRGRCKPSPTTTTPHVCRRSRLLIVVFHCGLWIINTLTYKQKPAENIKLNPSSVPPAVEDFCAQQTHFCEMPKRIPVKKHEPYNLTSEMLMQIIEEVTAENKKEEKKKLDEENKQFKEFDIAHAKAIEGRTWVNDLPEDMQFADDVHETRKQRFEQMNIEL